MHLLDSDFSCPAELTFIASNDFGTADAVGDSLRSTVKHPAHTCNQPNPDRPSGSGPLLPSLDVMW